MRRSAKWTSQPFGDGFQLAASGQRLVARGQLPPHCRRPEVNVRREETPQPGQPRHRRHLRFVRRHRQRRRDLAEPPLHRPRRVEPPLVRKVAEEQREDDGDVDRAALLHLRSASAIRNPQSEMSGWLEPRELGAQRLLPDCRESHDQLGVVVQRFDAEDACRRRTAGDAPACPAAATCRSTDLRLRRRRSAPPRGRPPRRPRPYGLVLNS